jgi:hypothetical protein
MVYGIKTTGVIRKVSKFFALLGVLMAFGLLAAFTSACGLFGNSGSSTLDEKLGATLGKIATAAADAWANGGSTAASSAISQYVSAAQSSGELDGTEASAITAATPVLVSFLDSLAAQYAGGSATSTPTSDSTSKGVAIQSRALVERELLVSELAAKLKAKLAELLNPNSMTSVSAKRL